MERYLKQAFTYQWATPRGGDIGIWTTHLAAMRQELADNMKKYTEAIQVCQAADREAAIGNKSLVVNGDMEGATGWRFARVTAERGVGYADGGYVTDKAWHGSRSYRIKHLPVPTILWIVPTPRTTWAKSNRKSAFGQARSTRSLSTCSITSAKAAATISWSIRSLSTIR